MYPDKIKDDYGNAKVANDTCAQAVGYATQSATTGSYRPPTMREQAEKNAQYHFDLHIKAQQAASFLAAHPEFDEFIRLIRSGALEF